MKSPNILIIIVQYNNSPDTIRCLNSVRELGYDNYNVVVIDNLSSPKDFNSTRLFIESLRDQRFILIGAESNLGYSGGNNLGVKQALAGDSEYVFILNPDTTVQKDSLSKLVWAAESDFETGILGPAINEGEKIVYGGEIGWLKPELKHPDSINNDGYVPGAAMLIKRKTIEKVGLLDERYFLYFEDADYCLRAKQKGFRLKIVADAIINHRPSSSTSTLGNAILLRYHFRNAHLFNWKNAPWYIKTALPFWSIFIIIKQLIKIMFMPSKREVSRAILAGVTDFYGMRFGKIND